MWVRLGSSDSVSLMNVDRWRGSAHTAYKRRPPVTWAYIKPSLILNTEQLAAATTMTSPW